MAPLSSLARIINEAALGQFAAVGCSGSVA